MYNYEMDTTRTLGATEQTRDVGRMDGRTDGQSETNISPNNFIMRRVYIWYTVENSLQHM